MLDDIKICPYTGLRPFTEEESIYFKGRDEHIEQATRQLEKNKFINELRERVSVWRKSGYEGLNNKTTQRLLEYWTRPDRDRTLRRGRRQGAGLDCEGGLLDSRENRHGA